MNVGLFLFDDIELLDFAGPYEVFSIASEQENNNLNVFTVTEHGNPIQTFNGLKVIPDYSFNNHPQIDILIIPGGQGTKTEMEKGAVLTWINENFIKAKLTMSVCSGARILGKLGLLDGIESTTHHEVMEDMSAISPSTIIRADKRFVHQGNILTAAGISAGIDASIYVVRKFFGNDTANEALIIMEYGNWEDL